MLVSGQGAACRLCGAIVSTLMLLVNVPVHAQSFQHIYTTTDAGEATAVAQTSDGGYIVAGYTMSVGNGSAVLMKFGATGSLQWERAIGLNSFEIATDVVQSSLDDGYVVVGSTWGGPTLGGDLTIIKTDASGNQQWERTVPGIGSVPEGPRVIETDPGRFVISGRIGGSQVAGPLPYQQAPFLVRVTSSGALDWFKVYRELGLGVSQYASFSGVRRTSDGGYIATGFIAEEVWGFKGILLMKTDADGVFQWAKRYGFDNFNDRGDGIELAANGDYLITGYSKSIVEGGGAYVLRTDPTGNVLWFRTFMQFSTGGAIRELPGGDILLGGGVQIIASDAAMMRMNSLGVPYWARAYGDMSGLGYGWSVLPSGSDLVMAGFTTSYTGNQDIFFLRADSNGVIGCFEYPFNPISDPHPLPVVDLNFQVIPMQTIAPIVFNHSNFLPQMTDPCSQNEIGACCWREPQTGFFHCVQTSESDCDSYPNSTFLGIGVSCSPNPCPNPAPEGACCYTNAAGGLDCVTSTELHCIGVLNGTYQGNGVPCDSTTCDPGKPTGACCHVVDSIMLCTDATALDCKYVYQGKYYGDGSSCLSTECEPPPPPTGACCYTDPAAGSFCMEVTEAECLNDLEGTYFGNGVACDAKPCEPDCTPPPIRMGGWWPMDEVSGSTAHDVILSNHGTHVGSPAIVPGKVGNALSFTQGSYVEVPNSPTLNPGTSDFSIDAWIRTTAGVGYWPIVTKFEGWNPTVGWGLTLNSGGALQFRLNDGSSLGSVVSGVFVNDGEWKHVAITVERNSSTGIKFYVNGAHVWSGSSLSAPGSVSNSSPMQIGGHVSGSAVAYFEGEIDEVEYFPRLLSPGEIAALYQAGVAGKCKVSCRPPKWVPFCANHTSRDVIITVCNHTPFAAPMQLDFQGLPVGVGCSINGPTVFNVVGGNPVMVPPFSCQNVTVNIQRPAGMNTLFQTACYEVTVTNLTSGHSSTCGGYVMDRRDLCPVIRWDTAIVRLPIGLIRPITLQVTKWPSASSSDEETVSYVMTVLGPDGTPSTVVSVNGNAPGEPAVGEFIVRDHETVSVPFFLLAHEHALDASDFVVMAQVGQDSAAMPLDSIVVETVTRRAADLNGDGVVNVSDLLLLLGAWGPCTGCIADINGDDVVNVSDLLRLFGDWG